MAGGAPVNGPREHGHARGNAREAQFLSRPLDEDFVHARRHWWKKIAVRGRAQALARAGNPDKALGPVVPRGHLLVSDRPGRAQAVFRLKVVVRKTEGNAPVVIGPAAQDARAEPAEVLARGHRVGLAG